MKRKVKDSTSQAVDPSAPHDHDSPESASNTTESEKASGATRPFNTRERGGLWHFPPPGLWPLIDFTEGRANDFSSINPHPGDGGEHSSSTNPPSDPPAPRSTHSIGQSSAKDTDIPYLEAQPVSEELLPPMFMQERLIGLYFAHVHPVLPIIHQGDFLEAWRTSISTVFVLSQFVVFVNLTAPVKFYRESAGNLNRDVSYKKPRQHEVLSQALLFAMFAVAARYLDEDTTALPKGSMWTAGLPYRSHSRHALCGKLSVVMSLLAANTFHV